MSYKSKLTKSLFILGSLLASHTLEAGDLFLEATIRERFETLDGMNKKEYGDTEKLVSAQGKSDDKLLVNRVNLGLIYKPTSDITFKAIGYYADVFGWSLDKSDFKKVSGNEIYYMNPQEDLDFSDLNLEVKNLAGVQGLSTKIGRSANKYGDKRVLGPGSWGNSYGWLWDLAKFSYKFDKNFIDIFYGQTKDKDAERLSLFGKHVYEGAGLYTHFSTSKNGALEPFCIYKNGLYTGAGNGENSEKSITYGFRAYDNDLFGFTYELTYAKADGTLKTKNYDAYGYVAKFGYQFKGFTFKPTLVLGQIYASGDSNPEDNTVQTFRTPFGGTDGSLYGRMDIMKWSNLIEDVIELHLKPTPSMQVKLSYHDFSLAESEDEWTYYKKSNLAGNNYDALGEEYDFEYKLRYNKTIEFQAIYAYFHAGAFVVKNVADNNAQRIFLQMEDRFNK